MPFKQRPRKRRKSSPSLAKLAAACLHVAQDDVRDFQPCAHDIKIAQSLLEGSISIAEISESSRLSDTTVRKALKDPVAFAWICQRVSALIHTRIGLVDAALLRKACAGDVRAMETYYKRFGKLAELKVVAHGKLGDFTQYSDDDLDAAIRSAVARDPSLVAPSSSPSSADVIDVPATPVEEPTP